MTQLTPYLSFNDNCREAMEFYKACLGGELTLQTVGESPMAQHMEDKKDLILHSMLKKDGLVLMASDTIMGDEAKSGNNITLAISEAGLEELQTYFDKLSQDGTVTQKLEETFFGTYGALTDKFGIKWMFQSDSKKEE